MTSETGKDKLEMGGTDRPHATLDLKAKEIFSEGAPQAALPPGGAPMSQPETEPAASANAASSGTAAGEMAAPAEGSGAGGFLGNLTAAVIGAVLALAGAYFFVPARDDGREEMGRALASALQRLAAVENATRSAGGDGGAGEARMRGVMEQTAALRQEFAALNGRMQALESRPATAASPSPEALQQSLQPVSSKLGELENRLASLAKAQDDLRASTGTAALTMAVQNLRRAVADGKPFASELKTLASLTPEPLDAAPLEARRASGLPSLASLQRDFDLSAKAAIDAARPNGDGTLTGDLLARARSLVRVRPTGDIPGDGPEAILARAENRLDSGDLPAAIRETGQLAGPAAQAMNPWLTEAKARVAADEALAKIEAKLTSLGSGDRGKQGG
jgi:hypothetical protein